MINESKILELIKRQKETGLTITAFCANEGIPKSSYYYWRKKLNREPGKRFIPLLVNSTPATMSGPFKELHPGSNMSITPQAMIFFMELHYPNGTKLRTKKRP